MELANLNEIILKRGCQLKSYTEGKAALLQLPSKEEVMISIGTSSFRVFKKGLLGWITPKTLFSVDLAALGWNECIPLTRVIVSTLLVTQSLDLLSRSKSIDDAARQYRDDFTERLVESMAREMEIGD